MASSDWHANVVQPAGLQAPMSVDALLESVLKTNPRVPDARAAIASRVHNKVFLLENPTAALTTKPKYKKHNKRLAGQLLSCKKRPALGTNHKYVLLLGHTTTVYCSSFIHMPPSFPTVAGHHLLNFRLYAHHKISCVA